MDELEHQLYRNLIAIRAVVNDMPRPDLIDEMTRAERQLYEYQLKIGSPAVYWTYERR